MASENVDAFLAGAQAINRGDVEGLLRVVAEDATFLPHRSAVEGGYHGHDGLRRYLADNAETFEIFELGYTEVRDLGDQVLAIGTAHIRGRGGGVETDVPVAGLATYEQGKVARWEDFGDRRLALKAAGVAMSANLDLVRSIFAAWERGDFSSIEWAHPDIELVDADGLEPGSRTGVAAMAEAWRGFLAAWDDLRAEAEQYREIDSERVLVFVHNSGSGKASGLELGQMHTRSANLFHVRGGKVTRLVLYSDRGRALADLGFAPEAGSP